MGLLSSPTPGLATPHAACEEDYCNVTRMRRALKRRTTSIGGDDLGVLRVERGEFPLGAGRAVPM